MSVLLGTTRNTATGCERRAPDADWLRATTVLLGVAAKDGDMRGWGDRRARAAGGERGEPHGEDKV
jgi:hypothetical protein